MLIEVLVAQSGSRPQMWTNGIDVQTFLGNLIFTQNISGWFGSYAPAWSLTCEMAYYLMWPVALWAFGYKAEKAAIGAALIAFALAALLFKIGANNKELALTSVWMLLYMSLLWYAGAFVAARWEAINASRLLQNLSRLWLPGLIAVFYLEYSGLINMHIRNLALGPVFVGMLINLHRWPDWLLCSKSRTDTLGHLSYPLYLLHGPLIILFATAALAVGLQPSILVGFVMIGLLTLAISHFIGIPLEVRLLSWRRDVLRRLTPVPARA